MKEKPPHSSFLAPQKNLVSLLKKSNFGPVINLIYLQLRLAEFEAGSAIPANYAPSPTVVLLFEGTPHPCSQHLKNAFWEAFQQAFHQTTNPPSSFVSSAIVRSPALRLSRLYVLPKFKMALKFGVVSFCSRNASRFSKSQNKNYVTVVMSQTGRSPLEVLP